MSLVITYEACSSNNCYASKTLKKMISGKSFVLLVNQRTFDENSFDDHPFIEESKVIWVPIGLEMREDNFFQL